MTHFISSDSIRTAFSTAMSHMYRDEVPAYGELVDIVARTNAAFLSHNQQAHEEDTARLSEERHGAIRVGTAAELAMLGRIFAIMGMHPVSYYDLGSAGIPVHSTAFRPIQRQALAANPFRVFTSLLRLELIEDEAIRSKAEAILQSRSIFTDDVIALTWKAEEEGGLDETDAPRFVQAVLETFRWTGKARVDETTYDVLHDLHRLIADVVSFQGPHINHLTPRTLDIDACQQAMVTGGLPAKAIIEGPPPRNCPILLRQTSFKALKEAVQFKDSDTISAHTARFGEIEQRGIALTPLGRERYDSLLASVREVIKPAADGSNASDYMAALSSAFAAFPDEWRAIYDQKLGYFRYHRTDAAQGILDSKNINTLLDEGKLTISPIIYEDFLPVSAAGIFQSNLGDDAAQADQKPASQTAFETALGMSVLDEFTHYQKIQDASLKAALAG